MSSDNSQLHSYAFGIGEEESRHTRRKAGAHISHQETVP